MFYDRDEIGDLLQCPSCEERFREPCMLPCGHSLCARCTRSEHCITESSSAPSLSSGKPAANLLKCKECDEVHVVPEHGFQINKILLKLLEAQPKEVYRGKDIESLGSLLKEIRAKRASMLDLLDATLDERIREHYNALRDTVQTATEQAIQHIYTCQKRLMAQIDDHEASLLQSRTDQSHALLVDEQRKKSRELAARADKFAAYWSKCITRLKAEDDKTDIGQERAQLIRDELNKQFEVLSAQLFAHQSLSFELNENTIRDECLLGRLTLENLLIKSPPSPPSDDSDKCQPQVRDMPSSVSSSSISSSSSSSSSSSTAKATPPSPPPTATVALATPSLSIASDSQRLESLFSVDFAKMEQVKLDKLLPNMSFVRVIGTRDKQHKFALFYRQGLNLHIRWHDQSSGKVAYTTNPGLELTQADCLTCEFNGEIAILIKLRQRGKAIVKLYNSRLICYVVSSVLLEKPIVRVAMNERLLFVARGGDGSIDIFQKSDDLKQLGSFVSSGEILHIRVTSRFLFILDAQGMLTVRHCSDLKRVETCFPLFLSTVHKPFTFCIYHGKYVFAYNELDTIKFVGFTHSGGSFTPKLFNKPNGSNLILGGECGDRLAFLDLTASVLYY